MRNLVLSALILLAAVTSFADDSPFSISKGLKLVNTQPRVVAGGGGNVLVAWIQHELEDPNNSKLYAALCRAKKNGTYKVGKAVVVESDGKDTYAVPATAFFDVAYNPEDDSYVAVWKKVTWNSKLGYYIGDVFSRKINGKGRLKGGINKLTSSDEEDTSPALQYMPAQAGAPASKGSYLLVFIRNQFAETPQKPDGIWKAALDHGGAINGDGMSLLRRSTEANIGRVSETIHDLEALDDGSFVLGYSRYDSDLLPEALMVKTTADGEFVREILLSEARAMQVEVVQLSKKFLLTCWSRGPEYQEVCVDRLLRTKLKAVKKEFAPLAGMDGHPGRLVRLTEGAYQITHNGGTLYGRTVSAKGKLGPEAKALLSEWIPIECFDAVALTGGDKVFIAWSNRESDTDYSVKGIIVSPD